MTMVDGPVISAVEVDVAVEPVPQGSVDVYNGRVVQPKKVKDYRRVVASAIRALGAEQFTGPCRVELGFVMTRPQAHYGKGRNSHIIKESSPVSHTYRPDLDKLVRCVLDAITDSGLWNDDAQVVHITASKSYGEEGHVSIRVLS